MSAGSTLVVNERIKLTAGLLNTVAGFSITAGGIGPLIAISYGLGSVPLLGPWAILTLTLIWIVVGISLHLVARFVLGRLKP